MKDPTSWGCIDWSPSLSAKAELLSPLGVDEVGFLYSFGRVSSSLGLLVGRLGSSEKHCILSRMSATVG